MGFLRDLRFMFTGNFLSKNERLQIYKNLREELTSNSKDGVESYIKGFCEALHRLNRQHREEFGMLIKLHSDLPELFALKPAEGWISNNSFWFEANLIKPRLELLDKVIGDLEK